MARIILENKGQVLKDFSLQKGSLTIGRRRDNTVFLGDPQVSVYHARIDKRGSEHILTDLQSTNGTFVNNLRVFSHLLRHGDRISIGKHTLLFIGTEKARIDAELEKYPLDKTVIIGTPRRPAGRLIEGRNPVGAAVQQPKASGLLGRLFFVFFLVALILGIGFWGLHGKPDFFRGVLSKGKTGDRIDFRTLPVQKQELLQAQPEPQDPGDAMDASDEASGLSIDAIVWSSDEASSFALINGVKVVLGQPIDGMTVAEIGRDYVVLRSHDGESTVRLTLTLK